MNDKRIDKDVEELKAKLREHFDSFFHQVHFYVEIKDWYEKGIDATARDLLKGYIPLSKAVDYVEVCVHCWGGFKNGRINPGRCSACNDKGVVLREREIKTCQ